MTEKLKKIADEIRRIAEGELDGVVVNKPPATSGATPPPATTDPGGLGDAWSNNKPVAPRGGGGVGYSPAIGEIKKLQQAMQNFAAGVTKYSFKKPSKPGEKPAVDDSKKPFNDFITEQYMSDSPIKGQEFSTDPNRQKLQEKQPTDLIEMNNVIDGLKRIGSPGVPPGSELRADNVWDFRTNNALKNIYAFAHALVNLSKDFGRTNVQSFGEEDLSKMAELIPKEEDPSKLPAATKIAKAKGLVPLINKLSNFYTFYVDAIANHPGYVRYILGEEPLMTVKPGGGDPLTLTPEEQKMMQNADQLTVDFGKGPFPLKAFQNLNYFRQFLTDSLGYKPNQTSNPKILLALLKSFSDMADQAIQKSQPKTTPPPKQDVDAGTPPSGTGGVRQV